MLFESTHSMLLILDPHYRVCEANPAARTGFMQDRLEGLHLADLFPELFIPDSHTLSASSAGASSAQPSDRLRVLESGQLLEARCHCGQGKWLDTEINLTPIRIGAENQQLLHIRDISLDKRYNQLILNIARGISADTGEHFFQSLLSQLSQVLDADYAFIAQLDELQPNQAQTLTTLHRGRLLDNFVYDLRDSPFQDLLQGRVCVQQHSAFERFPADQQLQRWQIQSAIAAPLLDNIGMPLGVMVILSCTPLEDASLSQHLMHIFAIRAAAELQRKRSESALIASEERYRDFINNISEGMWRAEMMHPVNINTPIDQQVQQIIDSFVILEANKAMARMYGYSLEQFYDMPSSQLIDTEILREQLTAFVEQGYQVNELESCQRRADGTEVWLSSYFTGVIADGQLLRIWGTCRDITETKAHLSTIHYQAEHDSLTRLPNRFWLTDRLQQLLHTAPQSGGLTLMMLDFDHFKEINNSLGHHTGDQLLCMVGPRLQPILQKHQGEIARLGGDEFAIVFPRTDRDAAADLAACINSCLREPFELQGINLELQSSIGIACYPEQGHAPADLLRCAEVAMYHAKNNNRPFSRYDAACDQHSPRRLALISELGQAIRQNQLLLHFQPKLDLDAQRIVSFEALVRWQHPIQGIIPPGEFVQLAEMGDLIRPLTLWVLDRALAECRKWRETGQPCRIAVNLSTRNLLDDACPQQIQSILHKHDLPPSCLELEITESSLISDPQRALRSLREINEMGVTLAIDDFGTGYSSLAYLKELPIHCLKIDMSFVRNMSADQRDAMIVNSTINLAHNLGLTVVAEGVEDEETLERLQHMRCNQVQGYYIGRPMSCERIPAFLQQFSLQ